MTKRDARLYLYDILTSIEIIEGYFSKSDKKDLFENQLLQDAVVRRLEIIGEASKGVPLRVRNANEEVPWKKIIGFRNVVSHEYFGINLERVWNIVKKDLPELKKQIKKIYIEEGGQDKLVK